MSDCPHCQAFNEFHGAFCASCGKALPSPTRTAPRIIQGADLAASALGQELQGEDLIKTARKSVIALTIIGVVQFITAAVVFGVARSAGAPTQSLTLAVGVIAGIGVVFLSLACWARFNPLAASITGLTLYISGLALDAISSPENFARGFILKLIIISVLCKAVHAGIKYRELRRLAALA
jgi:hypothetical protein